jgi:hypothetical protein
MITMLKTVTPMQQLLGRGIWEVREVLLSADFGADESEADESDFGAEGDSGADESEESSSLEDTFSTG